MATLTRTPSMEIEVIVQFFQQHPLEAWLSFLGTLISGLFGGYVLKIKLNNRSPQAEIEKSPQSPVKIAEDLDDESKNNSVNVGGDNYGYITVGSGELPQPGAGTGAPTVVVSDLNQSQKDLCNTVNSASNRILGEQWDLSSDYLIAVRALGAGEVLQAARKFFQMFYQIVERLKQMQTDLEINDSDLGACELMTKALEEMFQSGQRDDDIPSQIDYCERAFFVMTSKIQL